MKKLLLALPALALGLVATAQKIQVKDSGGNIINGQTVNVNGMSWMGVVKVEDIDIYNNDTTDMDIKMKRYEVNVQAGTGNSYCWSICTNEAYAGQYPVWAQGPVQPVGAGTAFTAFTADHYPHGIVGQNEYRYVWYNYANPNDSAYLDITFDIALGQEELNPDEYIINVFPNPAVGSVNFKVDGNNHKDVKIIMTDALGKTVKTIEVPENNGVIKVNVSEFNPGVYFYTLQINRKAISTRRLMVTR